MGILGENCLGSGFAFDLEVRKGAGAFVCGEETALIASLEGRRGSPRTRPPYPAVSGYHEKPTNINNVETFANVPVVMGGTPERYAGIGTESSKGTKIFALAGTVINTGLVEVPMGATLRQIVFDIGGGIPANQKFKAVQLGGPSGGCVPPCYLDHPLDYDSVEEIGAIMGSGGLIVMDENNCMVDVARYFMEFVQSESCGKCTPCRIGTRKMLEVLNRICEGKGKPVDIDLLKDLAKVMKDGSLCALGTSAPNPILTTLEYFAEEYEAHIRDKKCPAKVCRSLISYSVVPDKCTGCTACAKICPIGAAHGKKKETHEINPQTCIKCGLCKDACKFDAIAVT